MNFIISIYKKKFFPKWYVATFFKMISRRKLVANEYLNEAQLPPNCPKKKTFTALCVQFAIIELSSFEFSQIYFKLFVEKWDFFFFRKLMQKIQKKIWKRRGLKEEKLSIWTRVKSLRFNLHQTIKRWKWTRGTLCKYRK